MLRVSVHVVPVRICAAVSGAYAIGTLARCSALLPRRLLSLLTPSSLLKLTMTGSRSDAEAVDSHVVTARVTVAFDALVVSAAAVGSVSVRTNKIAATSDVALRNVRDRIALEPPASGRLDGYHSLWWQSAE